MTRCGAGIGEATPPQCNGSRLVGACCSRSSLCCRCARLPWGAYLSVVRTASHGSMGPRLHRFTKRYTQVRMLGNWVCVSNTCARRPPQGSCCSWLNVLCLINGLFYGAGQGPRHWFQRASTRHQDGCHLRALRECTSLDATTSDEGILKHHCGEKQPFAGQTIVTGASRGLAAALRSLLAVGINLGLPFARLPQFCPRAPGRECGV